MLKRQMSGLRSRPRPPPAVPDIPDRLRPVRHPRPPAVRPPSPRTVTGWILTHPDTLPESELRKLKSVLTGCPELDALTGHVRAFGKQTVTPDNRRVQTLLCNVPHTQAD